MYLQANIEQELGFGVEKGKRDLELQRRRPAARGVQGVVAAVDEQVGGQARDLELPVLTGDVAGIDRLLRQVDQPVLVDHPGEKRPQILDQRHLGPEVVDGERLPFVLLLSYIVYFIVINAVETFFATIG